MKSKLSLTVIYIVLIVYFKVKLPEYTVQELEHDLKITLYACYSDTLVPFWKHLLYDIDNRIRKEEINHRGNSASNGEETPKKKESNDNLARIHKGYYQTHTRVWTILIHGRFKTILEFILLGILGH